MSLESCGLDIRARNAPTYMEGEICSLLVHENDVNIHVCQTNKMLNFTHLNNNYFFVDKHVPGRPSN